MVPAILDRPRPVQCGKFRFRGVPLYPSHGRGALCFCGLAPLGLAALPYRVQGISGSHDFPVQPERRAFNPRHPFSCFMEIPLGLVPLHLDVEETALDLAQMLDRIGIVAKVGR